MSSSSKGAKDSYRSGSGHSRRRGRSASESDDDSESYSQSRRRDRRYSDRERHHRRRSRSRESVKDRSSHRHSNDEHSRRKRDRSRSGSTEPAYHDKAKQRNENTSEVAGISMKLAPTLASKPATGIISTPKPAISAPVVRSSTVASIFNADDDDEEEEMPPEAKMRMKNVGRNTPTSAGPNSFGKTKIGFCNSLHIAEKELEAKELGHK